MRVVDLHGVRYKDVYEKLEMLCVDLHVQEKLGNSGRLIICESR